MALQDAGEELLVELSGINIAVLCDYNLVLDEGKALIETPGDAHAGEIETSRIMHSHPHLVKGLGEREFPDFPQGMLVRNKKKYWPSGIWGDPSKASAEKGHLLEERVAKKILDILKKMEVFVEQ